MKERLITLTRRHRHVALKIKRPNRLKKIYKPRVLLSNVCSIVKFSKRRQTRDLLVRAKTSLYIFSLPQKGTLKPFSITTKFLVTVVSFFFLHLFILIKKAVHHCIVWQRSHWVAKGKERRAFFRVKEKTRQENVRNVQYRGAN